MTSVTAPSNLSSTNSTSNEVCGRMVSLSVTLKGVPGAGEFIFLTVYNGEIIIEIKWEDYKEVEMNELTINLNDNKHCVMIASNPIIFLLRSVSPRASKQDPDPLLNTDNRAGGTVDLLPLLLGRDKVFTTVHLVSIYTGEYVGLQVIALAKVPPENTEDKRVPLLLTMISGHCLPPVREGTDYISAIGLTDLHQPHNIQFNQSLSSPAAQKLVWATASNANQAANTAFSVSSEDKFIPDDLKIQNTENCRSCYWNALYRVLVDPEELIKRLSSPFLIDVAGVAKGGRMEVRGRYMGWADAGSLLIPGETSVIMCAKLFVFNETQAESYGGGLLNVPPTSAKGASARETDMVYDESGHNSYVVIRFDVTEPIVPKEKLEYFYETMGFPPPVGSGWAIDSLDVKQKPSDHFVDVGIIRKECGALAVHQELSHLSCTGGILMPQSKKRSTAHRLLTQIRTMLRNFSPGDCSHLDWQDAVTIQHAASRRAVTASFAPHPPDPILPDRMAAARARIAGDNRLSDKYVKMNLQVAGSHPRSLICKVLRCLEERNDLDAKNYLLEALSVQTRNRYLLWILGAQEFDKGKEGKDVARAAFKIASKGDFSAGTIHAIAYAALHAHHHANGNVYAAHTSAKKMRKYCKLAIEWDKTLSQWIENSGEEEILWTPVIISPENPILIAAAFFLCLRCYKFCETLLQCVEKNCATLGSNVNEYPPCVDVYYLRAASYILRHQYDLAMEVIQKGIKKFGPSAMMSQIRLSCLSCTRQWDAECEAAFTEAEKAGWFPCPAILFKSALNKFKIAPNQCLQRAALAHKLASSGHTALLLGRIYERLGEHTLAERWCAVAVKTEPLLADGWAMLTLLAMYRSKLDEARAMLRAAKQVGPITPDIDKQLKKIMDIVGLDQMPDTLVKHLCLENKYNSSV